MYHVTMAVNFFEKEADSGHKNAQYSLAKIYEPEYPMEKPLTINEKYQQLSNKCQPKTRILSIMLKKRSSYPL